MYGNTKIVLMMDLNLISERATSQATVPPSPMAITQDVYKRQGQHGYTHFVIHPIDRRLFLSAVREIVAAHP